MKAIISPSMLSCDFANLERDAHEIICSGADCLHMDIMDGHFVPNITMGAPIIKSLRKHTDVYMDCHMMVENPEKWVKDFADAGASCYTFHIESADNVNHLINDIKYHAMDVGIAVKPGTPIEDIIKYLDDIDMVLIMTVEPGFGGQKFMEDMVDKIRWLRNHKKDINIGVDGGINEDTIKIVAEAGANVIISGSGIFGKGKENYGAVIGKMRETVDKYMI